MALQSPRAGQVRLLASCTQIETVVIRDGNGGQKEKEAESGREKETARNRKRTGEKRVRHEQDLVLPKTIKDHDTKTR